MSSQSSAGTNSNWPDDESIRRLLELVDQPTSDTGVEPSADDYDVAALAALLADTWSRLRPHPHAGDGTAPTEEPDNSPVKLPRRIGRFEIRSILGCGGFGLVLLANDPHLHREVALKLPRPEILLSNRLRQRFLREAQAAAMLDHSNIVPVYEAAELGPLWYLTRGYVAGPTLGEWIDAQGGAVKPRVAAEMVRQLAAAVDHAHSRGVLHRDLKPSNVLLEPIAGQPGRWVVKLADFGLAKRIEDTDHLSRQGELLGTPQYMAPEQATCRAADIAVHTDIYGLGVILFELLTGKPPYVGTNDQQTLQLIQEGHLPLPALRSARVPRDLEAVCLKCLAASPQLRYPAAAQLGADLDRFLAGAPVQARSVSRVARAWIWCRRNKTVASLTAAAFAALLVIAGTSSFAALQIAKARSESEHNAALESLARGRAEMARRDAQLAQQKAEANAERANQNADTLERQLYYNRISLISREWDRANIHKVQQLLMDCPPHLRHWEWHRFTSLSRLARLRLPLGADAVAWSPDGAHVATFRHVSSWEVSVWDSATGQKTQSISLKTDSRYDPTWVPSISWSPDSSRLVVTIDEQCAKIVDVSSGAIVHSLDGHDDQLIWVAWSPDGRTIATRSGDRTVKIWDARQGTQLQSLGPVSAFTHDIHSMVSWSPDSTQIAAGGTAGEPVSIWDVKTGARQTTVEKQSGGLVAWSFDGRHLAVSDGKSVQIHEPATGNLAQTLKVSNVRCIEWSRTDTTHLAVGTWDRVVSVWDVANGRLVARLVGAHRAIDAMSWHPSGHELVTGSEDDIRLWNLEDYARGSELRFPVSGAGLSWSPDSRRIAVACKHTLSIYSIPEVGEPITLTAPGSLDYVSWSNDGRYLAGAEFRGRTVWVWDVGTGNIVHTFTHDDFEVEWLAWGPNNILAAAVGDYREVVPGATHRRYGEIQLWDMARGAELRSLKGHVSDVESFSWSPTGNRLVSYGVDGSVRIWDAASGGELKRIQRMQFQAENTASDVGYAMLCAWSGVRDLVAFNDFGGQTANRIRIVDVESGLDVSMLSGHADQITALAWSPDARRLASSSADGTIKVWDPETGFEVTTFSFDSPVRTVSWSPNGRYLSLATTDSALVWDSGWAVGDTQDSFPTDLPPTAAVIRLKVDPAHARVVAQDAQASLSAEAAEREVVVLEADGKNPLTLDVSASGYSAWHRVIESHPGQFEELSVQLQSHTEAIKRIWDSVSTVTWDGESIEMTLGGTQRIREIDVGELSQYPDGLAFHPDGRIAFSQGHGAHEDMQIAFWEKGQIGAPVVNIKWTDSTPALSGSKRAEQERSGLFGFFGGPLAFDSRAKCYFSLGNCVPNGIYRVDAISPVNIEKLYSTGSLRSLQIPAFDNGFIYATSSNGIWKYPLDPRKGTEQSLWFCFEHKQHELQLYLDDTLILSPTRLVVVLRCSQKVLNGGNDTFTQALCIDSELKEITLLPIGWDGAMAVNWDGALAIRFDAQSQRIKQVTLEGG